MLHSYVVGKTIRYVQKSMKKYDGGHDWWHIQRVWSLSKTIAQEEKANLFVVELGALLHDIADPKFHNGDETIGPRRAKRFLRGLDVPYYHVDHVVNIMENVSFRSSLEDKGFKSLELDIVQDADRLDAIGAIGIARAFNYGGFKNRAIYDPRIKPVDVVSKEDYKKSGSSTLNHFYEKLLLLKDRMNTKTGRMLAEQRHRFMEDYLAEFHKEWNGEA